MIFGEEQLNQIKTLAECLDSNLRKLNLFKLQRNGAY